MKRLAFISIVTLLLVGCAGPEIQAEREAALEASRERAQQNDLHRIEVDGLPGSIVPFEHNGIQCIAWINGNNYELKCDFSRMNNG